jgi:uncharacterized repeat protein (TIGR04076 family)
VTEPQKGYKVQVRVTGHLGQRPCWIGNKAGDTWIFEDETLEGFCQTAFQDIYPAIVLLRNGGSVIGAEDRDVVKVSCADPDVMVQYEIRRLPAEG